jgi:hypothetical protein
MDVPPLPTANPELQRRITEAVASITRDILAEIWEEMKYRIDVPVSNVRFEDK